jgi:tRNA threonylcarbamoyl adenosine modification protein (Sua5/YciO/YrdC/YwlC family)
MIILSKEEFELNNEEYLRMIRKGAVFIYPTDTIYGIGCIATNPKAVNKIREIKQRPTMPFTIIIPSKEWIYKNCVVKEEHEEWIKKLPGPYTLLFKLQNTNAVPKEVNNNLGTIGVRIPAHWLTKYFQDEELLIITTSVNISGEEYMTSLNNLDERIKAETEFIIYEGEIIGKPSTIVDLTGEEAKIINR